MLRSVWDRYSFYYWISKCFLHQLISFGHCHFLSHLVDICCFQHNTCAHKKKYDFTQLKKWNCKYTLICNISRHCHQSYACTVYLVCESSLNILSLDFMFIPYITFNSAVSRVVMLPECPCRLLTSTEAQMISYVCCATLWCQNEMPSGNCRRLECKWDLHKEAH